MGLLDSFNIGVTGLQASGAAMSVTGDNIANAGTVGFKKSRAEFQDLLSKSLKGIDGGDQVGSGVRLAHITPMFNQGSISRTENITDVAINGPGFFEVDTPWGKGYTRDGQFRFDKEGYLVNGEGYKVVGFESDIDGNITNKQSPIRLGNTTIPAVATKKVDINMNLDSREKVKQFDPNRPEETSSYNTGVTVYDSGGTPRLLTVYFNKAADNTWEYHAMVDGKDAAGGQPGQMIQMGSGQVVFNEKGLLQLENQGQNGFNFNNGASPGQQIAFNFGKSITEGGDGRNSTTQFGSASSVERHVQDGSSAATLGSLSFNDKGILTAAYTNGETRDLGQIGIIKFENNEGLFKVGKNLYKESRNSGQGAMGKPLEGGRGEIFAKSIELSNTDIAQEFIGLMNSQRNFQANTKTITTADAMLQEVLNIKR